MFKKLLNFSLLMGVSSWMVGQTTIQSQISSPSDDVEEYIFTPENDSYRTQGSVDLSSSDIELGAEQLNGKNPSIAGLRFTGLDIPQGAQILSARIIFTVDNNSKNEDPANYKIFIEDNVSPSTFSEDSADVSSRNWLNDSVAWNPEVGSWATIGEQESTSDVSSLVQQLVSKSDWEAGNALSFFITGTGVREAESSEDAVNAPILEVTYLPVTVAQSQIVSPSDDVEEYIYTDLNDSYRTQGSIDLSSSDIELGAESQGGKNPSIAGLRFTDLGIPQGAQILSANIVFTVDNTNKNEDPANYEIFAEDNVASLTFTEDSANVSERAKLTQAITWDLEVGSWATIGEEEITPDVAELVQQLVNKEDWTEGSPLTFFITGTGVREAESSETPDLAPKLEVRYIPVGNISNSVASSSDDAEEYIYTDLNDSYRTQGSMDVSSSDIELGAESQGGKNPSIAGLRFTNLELPKGAVLESAYIQFTVDNTNKNEDPANFFIHIEDNVLPLTFSEDSADISSRTWVNDSVAWDPEAGSWDVVGETHMTSDITTLIEQVINKDGWEEGNALAFFITGNGVREAESFDGSEDGAPKLILNYLQGDIIFTPELVREIPDQIVKPGWDVLVDLKPFFQDKDSELSFMVTDAIGGELPDGLEVNNGIVSGTLDMVTGISVKAYAFSDGDTISDVFHLAFEAENTSVLKELGSISLGAFDEGAAEISAFDPATQKLFVTNAEIGAINIVDLSDPENMTILDTITLPDFAGGVNSVAVKKGILVAALEDTVKQENGFVYAYDLDGTELWNVEVGALPDMVTFSEDGSKVIVANEGEPNDAYDVDPEGTVSIIDVATQSATTVDFTSLNGQAETLFATGVRVFGPNATVAQDLEPEYITVSGDTAFVTLQENNAVARILISTSSLIDVVGLGFKDYSVQGNGIDLPTTDGILIKEWDVLGMYQPDAITSFVKDGVTYLVTANEGDSRDYDGYSEESKISDFVLDANSITDADLLAEFGAKLKVTNAHPDTTATGETKTLYSFGTRSFSIWNGETGALVYDSGDELERITSSLLPANFNASNTNFDLKNRSDDKGPEPEAVAVGTVNGVLYAFIGLERVGGIMVYDLTDPASPEFVEYLNNRDFENEDENIGDSGPEGIVFVSASESPNNTAMIIVSNEVSGTISTYNVGQPEERFTLGIFHNNDGESDLLGDSITVNGVETYGGSISQFKFTLDSLRDQAEDRGYETMMLSSGDNFLAGLEYNASQADGIYYDALALDSLDYDAIDLGNHDFDFGTEILSEFIQAFDVNQAPYLSSNLSFENVPELKTLVDAGRITSSTIIVKGGEEIGVVGLTTPLLPIISSPGKTIVSEAVLDSAQTQIDLLIDAGVNKIILISHLQDLDEELDLATQLSGIDIIIAGGGDELLSNDPAKGAPYNLDAPVGAYPLVTQNANGNNVYVVTTPGNYRYLGNLLVDFDSEGNVTRVYDNSDLVLITGSSDQSMIDQIEDPINDFIGDLATNVIAVLEDSVDFRRENLRNKETNGGNLFADAILWQANETYESFGVSQPQVAIQNAGGLRVETVFEPGNLTEDKTYETAAFTNIVSVVENIEPEKFLELIEWGVASAPDLDGRFPQISGFEIVYDPAGVENEKVISITLDDDTKIVENGEVVAGAPSLTLATIDFTANGGDGYPFSPLSPVTLGATYQQAFLNYLTQGLDSLVTEAQYPFGMNERIFEQISVSEAVDSVVEDFSSVCIEDLEGWVEYNSVDDLSECVAGDYIQFNGYAVGTGESWIITPRVNFDEDDYSIEFTAENDFGRNLGTDVDVFYSTDYPGLGDPSGYTWVNIQEATDFISLDPKPESATSSGQIDLSSLTEEAHVAFVYYSDATNGGGSSRFSLYDLSIKPAEEVVTLGNKTIAEIQGAGDASPLENGLVITSGIVTATFDGEPYPGAGFNSNITGFYIQSNTPDSDPTTSEGLFISSAETVAVGDSVVVGGVVSELFNLTQLVTVDSFAIISSGNNLPGTMAVSLPLSGDDTFENYEGMLITFSQEMTVTENRNLDGFGEVKLSVDGLVYQPTQLVDANDVDPDDNTSNGNSNVDAVIARQTRNDNATFTLSDAREGSNLTPIPFVGTDGSLRAGTKVSNLSGVMTYSFGNYSLLPTLAPAFDYALADELPDLGTHSLKVISFNVLNYFNGDGQGAGFPTSRGAANVDELTKQTQKLVSAMVAMDGDVYALMEIENDEDNGFSAIESLVDSLNTTIGSETYSYVSTGIVKRSNGEFDEIKNGFIYKTATVDTVGDYAIINNDFDLDYEDEKNRPSVAQTFEEKSFGEKFTAVVCHLKSKGSDCDELGDVEDGDGQGECNTTRAKAAGAIASWLETDPTNSGDEDFIILGDINSYAQEDPIDTLRASGFTNLNSDSTFSYVFDGQYGALDHALVNDDLLSQVSGSDAWHINSIENDFKAYDGLESEFEVSPYWSSDHDPIMVGLTLGTVGLGDKTSVSTLSVYPNPMNGLAQFSESISGTVYNAMGIAVGHINDSSTIDLTRLPEGSYLVRTTEGKQLKVIHIK